MQRARNVLHRVRAGYGSGVNIAARLEGLAEPGGVWVSAIVREQVAGKVDVLFEDARAVDDHLAQMDADAKRHPPGRGQGGVRGAEPVLDRQRRTYGVRRARELGEQVVTR